ncbi:hypothetical protein NPIL_512401 [Nephila pilipes]|uniref:Uncharacterized protein n=1 Tax=Nephila pilipes TaxID=299642 RepID=A0A8X6QUY3_NEPPI|nr:hypothetical protein NPIL_512401 [Nephila pilipes]
MDLVETLRLSFPCPESTSLSENVAKSRDKGSFGVKQICPLSPPCNRRRVQAVRQGQHRSQGQCAGVVMDDVVVPRASECITWLSDDSGSATEGIDTENIAPLALFQHLQYCYFLYPVGV